MTQSDERARRDLLGRNVPKNGTTEFYQQYSKDVGDRQQPGWIGNSIDTGRDPETNEDLPRKQLWIGPVAILALALVFASVGAGLNLFGITLALILGVVAGWSIIRLMNLPSAVVWGFSAVMIIVSVFIFVHSNQTMH